MNSRNQEKPSLKGDKIMSNEDIINFYREQIAFAERQVNWYNEQIKWYGNMIKKERYDFGLTLEGEKMKKDRNKCYKERSYWRNKINEYEKKLVSVGA